MKTKKILLSLACMAILMLKSQVVPNKDWITYYSSQDTIENVTSDMDANNTVYTTGYVYTSSTNIDLIVQARDSTGLLLWTTLYNNGGTDKGKAIKYKAGVGLFVTGVSAGSGKDYVTIKLNAATGATVWTVRMNNFGSFDDEPNDITVDASGNSYVTGSASASGGGHTDIVTVKYNSSGTQQWKNTYAGTASNSNDAGNAIVLASNGNTVYITGNVNQSSGNCNIVTRAISTSTGTTNWTSTYNGSANGSDKSYNIILAGSNVVVCGAAANTTTGLDHLTIKYNGSTGTAIWTKTYDNNNYTNIATDLVRDSSGNIITTGYAYNNSTYSYHTIKYDSAGTQLFTNIEDLGLSSITVIPHVACDSIAHHIYVGGEALRATRDIFVYQISPAGNTKWKEYVDGQNYDLDAATSLVVNGIGVVYLSALSRNTFARYDITTIKISQTPVYFPLDYGTPEIKDPHFVFEENRGQLRRPNGTSVSGNDILYYNQHSSPSYYLNANTISHMYYDRDTIPDSLVRVDLGVQNANQYAQIFQYEPIEARKHYYTSSIPITDVLSYERLFIPNIKPNVDLHHFSNTSGLKSYFVFKTPGETIADFVLKVEGADSSSIDVSGNLIATTNLGNINMGMVTAYQATFNPLSPSAPVLVPLTANWLSLGSGQYRFSVSSYLPFWPVVVYVSKAGLTSVSATTPTNNLYWSTFLGDQGNDLLIKSKVDAKDNYYTVGYTTTGNFPSTAGGYQQIPSNFSSGGIGIMSKFNKLGKLDYSVYVGGLNSSCGNVVNVVHDVAIDSSYQVYLVGRTTSTNMATQATSAIPTLNYSSNSSTANVVCENAFLVKLSPLGSTKRMCSYFGGTAQERFNSVKYWNGQIHIAGWSTSNITPYSSQANSYTTSSGEGLYLHLDTSILVKHITKLQYNIDDLAMDNNGNAYVISSGYSSPYAVPIRRFSMATYTANNAGNSDWVLQRLGQNDSLTWSTYIGGYQDDYPTGISIRDTVLAIIGFGGFNFPIVKSFSDSGYASPLSTFDVQLMKMNTKTGQILWSVYHRSVGGQSTKGIAIDKNYNLYVAGTAAGVNAILPLSLAGNFQQNTNIGSEGYIIGFTNQNRRRWTTYFGSQSNLNTADNSDIVLGLSITNSDRMFICGHTRVKNNSMPLVQWNSSCYYQPLANNTTVWAAKDWEGLIAMFMVPNLRTVDIEEYSKTFRNENFMLYPNPNSGKFNIRFIKTPNEKINLSVMNSMGQIVFTKDNLHPNGDELNLDFSFLSKGIYLMTIENKQGNGVVKFIIE